MSETTTETTRRFKAGDQVEAAKLDGGTLRGSVHRAGNLYVEVRFDNGRGGTFYQGTGWKAWDDKPRWRLSLVAAVDSTGKEQQQ